MKLFLGLALCIILIFIGVIIMFSPFFTSIGNVFYKIKKKVEESE